MKAVLDLTKAITDSGYYREQFEGSGTDKNILFIEPQLASEHLYKYILPFFSFYNDRIYTAVTSLEKYSPFEQIVAIKTVPSYNEIMWANYIVFPFTTMDLSKEYGLYQAIREVNPSCKIVFFVDFNYYEVPDEHPHKKLFDFPNIIDSTERNVILADLCLTSNIHLCNYLLKKFTELSQTKYSYVQDISVNFGAIPYLIDEEIVLQNVDFEFSKPAPVINKDIFKKVAEVADEIKKEDLQNNKEKAIKLSNKKQAPKKAPKTKKVVAKRGRKPKSEKTEDVKSTDVESKIEAVNETVKPELKQLPKKYRIGIICSTNNLSDIHSYNQEFQKINETYGDGVSLIFINYDYENDQNKILDGVNFEYVKVSMIHFFKELQLLELDLVFVPLMKNNFNITSENTDKYLESSLFKIPLMVDDMFPYNQIIVHQRNGFLYKGKENFLQELDLVLDNPDLIKNVGEQSLIDTRRNYTFTQNNIDLVASIYI
jgi:hypothetical protein